MSPSVKRLCLRFENRKKIHREPARFGCQACDAWVYRCLYCLRQTIFISLYS
ncbi:MAG: hypothetical protein CVU10_08035 [Bacteroidetes bacterium HGW-Bacteroidetes-5]|nr:MAG: hypothetical protein CVU10_08035 [Bacteroidetes bacterium HGW-Bacteroidetes-5]